MDIGNADAGLRQRGSARGVAGLYGGILECVILWVITLSMSGHRIQILCR